jgi:Plasmid replication region DNA-binding N-term
MENPPSSSGPAYGTTRSRRASVSYGEVERAATALLKQGERPTIEKLRDALKGGAPDTIASALSRYWKDLGTRIEGDPASLSRLPAEIADLADTIWRRAQALAADAALQKVGADREGLEFFKRENELKAHALSLKEKELDALLRSRERTIQELETHLRTAMGFVQQREETIRAIEARATALGAEVEEYRRRLEVLIKAAKTRTRLARPQKQPPLAAATFRAKPKSRFARKAAIVKADARNRAGRRRR